MVIPLIGITTYNQDNKYGFPISALMHQYIVAISQAGGACVLIPTNLKVGFLRRVIDKVDGILFTGGGDLTPSLYHGDEHECLIGLDWERDVMEMFLVREVVTRGKPFLGICRGFQLINVVFGGTLHTHLPEQYAKGIKHDRDSGCERELLAHDVEIKRDTHLHRILGSSRLAVNSLHHQGVATLSSRLTSSAAAPDGLVEAAELASHPFALAVQWHPEWLLFQPASRRLFQAFIKAVQSQDSN